MALACTGLDHGVGGGARRGGGLSWASIRTRRYARLDDRPGRPDSSGADRRLPTGDQGPLAALSFIVLAALAGSAASIVTSSQGYVAKGSLLVNPVPEIITKLAGLALVPRASGSCPERPVVKTAATLMRSSAVTDRASELIDGELTPQQIEIGVEVTAEESENLISWLRPTDPSSPRGWPTHT